MNKLALIIALAMLLVGCNGDDNPSPPAPPQPAPPPPQTIATVTMNPSSWVFEHSPGMPTSPSAHPWGWAFAFPPANGVHYLTQSARGILAGTLSASFVIDPPNAPLFEVDPCGGNTPMVRLYFQRRGDDLQGTPGTTEFYRWWSVGVPLDGSVQALSAQLQPDQWSSVLGKPGPIAPSQFEAARADVQAIGVTFGGCMAGHGIYANGPANFIMTGFTIAP